MKKKINQIKNMVLRLFKPSIDEDAKICVALYGKGNAVSMVFYSGEDADLFNKKRFYYCVYWISETRIANKYTWTSARDFNFKNGEWK